MVTSLHCPASARAPSIFTCWMAAGSGVVSLLVIAKPDEGCML